MSIKGPEKFLSTETEIFFSKVPNSYLGPTEKGTILDLHQKMYQDDKYSICKLCLAKFQYTYVVFQTEIKNGRSRIRISFAISMILNFWHIRWSDNLIFSIQSWIQHSY